MEPKLIELLTYIGYCMYKVQYFKVFEKKSTIKTKNMGGGEGSGEGMKIGVEC